MKEKFIIYQVVPRVFGNTNEKCIPNSSLEINGSGKFNDFSVDILHSIKELGCTHIWFTGILEHATKTDYSSFGIEKDFPELVKGIAGSPFAVKDYYDVDPDLAVDVRNRLEEFSELISRCHKEGLMVLMDFVPNHVARRYHSDKAPVGTMDFGVKDKVDYVFHPMNNFYYILNEQFRSPVLTGNDSNQYIEHPAKATGNDCYRSDPDLTDWYETVKLNYGINYTKDSSCYFNPIPDTWHKMKDILTYWIGFGIDGFRCDMAGMVPVEFWEWVISFVKKSSPKTLFIAEIYNPEQYNAYLYKGGFDYLYDKVGLYDSLKMIAKKELPAFHITRIWQSLGENQNRMLNFLENHDEQRIASDFFMGNPNHVFPSLAVSLFLNTAPFMIYSGQELGERGMDNEGYSGIDGRTSIFDYWSMSTVRNWIKTGSEPHLRTRYRKLLNMALNEKAFKAGLTYDLGYANPKSDYFDPDENYVFLRYYNNELILVVTNFSKNAVKLKINIPKHSFDFFGISDKLADSGIDLIDGNKQEGLYSYLFPYPLDVAAYDIRVIKFLLQ